MEINEVVQRYEPLYYIGSVGEPKVNKTSLYVENKVEEILKNGLQKEDIPFILAWKIGNINHCQSLKTVIYKDYCNKTLIYKGMYGKEIMTATLVEYLSNNLEELKELAITAPDLLFKKLYLNRVLYFGTTYIITLIYFLSQGFMPIYDKYAYKALLYIKNKDVSKYRDISSEPNPAWKQYIEYCTLLLEVVGEPNYKDRKYDRALWVYGHTFK